MLASGAGLSLSIGLLAAIIGPVLAACALAWALSRTQALSAWRSAAEGYKEQVTEVTTRLTNAEAAVVELHAEVNRLSARPDYSAVVGKLDGIQETCTRIEGTVNEWADG